MKTLQDIPRIGEKMAQRFICHFGSEEAALGAILDGDIASISEVEGIGQRYAISLVHEVRAKVEGVSISDFLKTKESVDIYERLLDLIKQFAHTRYAKDKLHIYIPYPAAKIDRIESVRESVSYYMDTARLLRDNSDFLDLLSGIRPLNLKYDPPRIRERAIITANHEEFEYARQRFGSAIDVQMISTPSEFVDVARGYSHVIASGDGFLGFDFPEDIEPEYVSDLERLEDWQVVPEQVIGFFAKNLATIECSIAVTQAIRETGVMFFEQIDDKELGELGQALAMIDETGDVKAGYDPDIDRSNSIIENMDACISNAVHDANTRLDRCLTESKLTISGQDMLKVMSGDVELKEMLGKEVSNSYRTVTRETKERISSELGLRKKEMLIAESLFPDEIVHPVEVDRNQANALKQHVMHNIRKMKIEHKRNISKTLHGYRDIVRDMVRKVLDFDVGFAIGCFAHEYGLTMPELIDKAGIGFVKGENLFLRSRNGEVTPIDYSLGDTVHSPEDKSRVVLLSGVNSGGKTSMLELLAQCIILAHMGFPTPAKSLHTRVSDGFYYFAKSKGTLDAGAFETTLKDFSVVADDSGKVVLVDELESITEPGASARIIAGILEVLSENRNSMAVFVSHLPELILENTECSVRVDGIEASGLDPDLNLIVERTPRYNCIAKSTPELIVERLSRKTDGDEQAFYERLRAKF
ncbi:MAG TPA: endonuclease MutS2 [Methanosarcinaceae archaeon]|nr:endonuclease MutS2 [Methanosarcinaceae archaeon]